MSKERLSMRKITEILRLRHACGLTQRAIATSIGAAPSTVADYLRRATLAGLGWPLPAGMTEADVDRLLFPPPCVVPAEQRPVPDWAWVHGELKRKSVTLFLLWQEHRASHPDGFRYSWFCHHYREWAGRLDLVMRQAHLAGEKCFVDYAGQTVPVTDRYTGEIRHTQIFVAVLGASNYTYCEATWSQSIPDWIGSHVRMLDVFDAAPGMLVPDNLKSGVSRACRYDPELNPSYLDFARHYGIAVVPARAGKPRDKAKVEGGVLLVERWILARLRNRTFFSLAELNAAIQALLADLNNRPFKKMKGSRSELFRTLERPAMAALPAQRYVLAEWKKARVNVDYHIEVTGRLYSVPYALVGRQIDVRYTEHTVEIFHRSERVASHPRTATGSRYVTQAEHMPEKHRQMAAWTPERILRWAQTIGPHTAALIDALIAARAHPQQGFRAALGILRLAKLYGNARLEAACRRATAMNAVSYRSVESILKHHLDAIPLPTESQPQLPIFHDNVRGPDYYH
jgi:transposase